MTRESFEERMDFVVYGENQQRLKTATYNEEKPSMITYDAHGQTVEEARKTIKNIVNVSLVPLCLTVIHGYHHGTAIKDMLAVEPFSGRLINRYCPARNPGVTVMHVGT